MKISKKTGLIITAGIFIIVFAGVCMVFFQRLGEQDKLSEELKAVQVRLGGIQLGPLSSEKTELEEQLSQTTSQFEAVKAVLSQPIGSIAASDILLDIAQEHGVAVTEMSSSAPAEGGLEEVSCSVISLIAKVEGDVSTLVSFITDLNSRLTTGVVKSVTITIPETFISDNATADIQIAFYNYQGD